MSLRPERVAEIALGESSCSALRAVELRRQPSAARSLSGCRLSSLPDIGEKLFIDPMIVDRGYSCHLENPMIFGRSRGQIAEIKLVWFKI